MVLVVLAAYWYETERCDKVDIEMSLSFDADYGSFSDTVKNMLARTGVVHTG